LGDWHEVVAGHHDAMSCAPPVVPAGGSGPLREIPLRASRTPAPCLERPRCGQHGGDISPGVAARVSEDLDDSPTVTLTGPSGERIEAAAKPDLANDTIVVVLCLRRCKTAAIVSSGRFFRLMGAGHRARRAPAGQLAALLGPELCHDVELRLAESLSLEPTERRTGAIGTVHVF
jgi:hypothetical protein